jgi:ABC-type polysaccharide/polyol phosphate export permease
VPAAVAKAMQFNPLYHYLILFRGLLYDTTIRMDVLGMHLLYGFLFALLAFSLGSWFYVVNRDRLLFYL